MNSQERSIVWKCSSCQQKNRIQLSRWTESPKCGACHTALDTGAPQAVDSSSFDQVVRESALPVLVDFWAPWCGPCKMIAPVLEGAARTYQGKLLVTKVNTDEEPSLGARFQITGIPTLLLFKNGQIADQVVGAMPPAHLDRWIKQHI